MSVDRGLDQSLITMEVVELFLAFSKSMGAQ